MQHVALLAYSLLKLKLILTSTFYVHRGLMPFFCRTFSSYCCCTVNPIKQLKLLPVSDLLYIRDAVQMYKCMNNLAPSYLSQLFTKRSRTHSFLTRNRDSLQLPRCRTALAQQSFVFRGVTIWNSLPEELRNCSSIVSFKNQLKSELLSKWLND